MSLSRFAKALGPGADVDHLPPHADALTPAGRDSLIRWLRSWGCRHLRVQDHAKSSRSLRAWAVRWIQELPTGALVDLSDEEIARSAEAYAALSARPAAVAARPTGLVGVTFGQTAASKAMYALRPEAFPPWDAPMRAALALGEGPAGYERYVKLSTEAVRAIAAQAGIVPADLPAAVGRPSTTAARLIDEYLWRALTRGERV
jgi:hypothetical protein